MATVGLKRKRLCSAYGKRDDCGVDACPHQGRGQPHSHVWAVCPSPDAESHADHACGFRPSVRTKAASTLADGSLSGWVNHSRNAIEFASRHFASDYQHEHEPAASTGLVHSSKFDRRTPQCPPCRAGARALLRVSVSRSDDRFSWPSFMRLPSRMRRGHDGG